MGKNLSKYFLTIMSFVFLGYLINAYITNRDTRNTVISEEEKVGKCTHDDFEVTDMKWPKEEHYATGIIESISITNKGEYDCKDIRGTIKFSSQDGGEVGESKFVIYEEIRSKNTKIFRNIPIKPIPSTTAYRTSVSVSGTAILSSKAR